MHQHEHDNTGDLKFAFFLNVSFTLLELVGGVLVNSVAVLSDALHDLGDSVSLGLAWALEHYANRQSDQHYSYGYRRFSLLGAFINALILIGGSLFILAETIPRLSQPESFNVPGLILFAVIGVAANGAAALRLRGSSSTNAQVVGWHLIEDVLGWAAVLIVGIVALFADVPILDPILSLLIMAFVLVNVVRNLRKTAALFLQGVPRSVDLEAVRANLLSIEGVELIHHLHVWSLDGEHNVVTAHLVVPGATDKAGVIRIRRAAEQALEPLDVAHVTLAIEYDDEPHAEALHGE